jgi:hypothetical protein
MWLYRFSNPSPSRPKSSAGTLKARRPANQFSLVGRDINDPNNGILLRADIHALFDAGLITLTADGCGIAMSSKLSDQSYDFLRRVKVRRPEGHAPSTENISHHRRLFSGQRED